MTTRVLFSLFDDLKFLESERRRLDDFDKYGDPKEVPERIKRWRSDLESKVTVLEEKTLKRIEVLTDSNPKKIERIEKAWEATKKRKRPTRVDFIAEYEKLAPSKNRASNEMAIRQASVSFLERRYADHAIRHEFTQLSLPVRPDILAVDPANRENPVVAVEIKSDRDTFDRLYRQLTEYPRFATSVYAAVDARHYASYEKKFSARFPGVGLLVYRDGEIEEVRKPSVDVSQTDYFSMMWVAELKRMISFFDGRSKVSNSIGTLRAIVEAVYTPLEIREIARALVVERMATGKPSEKPIDHLVHGLAYKQHLFDTALSQKSWRNFRFDPAGFIEAAQKLGRNI